MIEYEPGSNDQPQGLSAYDQELEIVGANPMRLQTLDLARHSVAAPDGTRVVIATMNDTHMGRGYVTAVYPQQNNLTLLRLLIKEFRSETAEDAVDLHVRLTEAVQQGKLNAIRQGQIH